MIYCISAIGLYQEKYALKKNIHIFYLTKATHIIFVLFQIIQWTTILIVLIL